MIFVEVIAAVLAYVFFALMIGRFCGFGEIPEVDELVAARNSRPRGHVLEVVPADVGSDAGRTAVYLPCVPLGRSENQAERGPRSRLGGPGVASSVRAGEEGVQSRVEESWEEGSSLGVLLICSQCRAELRDLGECPECGWAP